MKKSLKMSRILLFLKKKFFIYILCPQTSFIASPLASPHSQHTFFPEIYSEMFAQSGNSQVNKQPHWPKMC